jgi:hypothetical protein
MAVLLLNACSVKIKDEQFCAPIPGHLGAVCDNFLTANQIILDEAAWQDLQNTWASAGFATECTSSSTLGDIKSEIEKLCSVAKCTYATKAKVAAVVSAISRMQAVAKLQTSMAAESK